MPRTDPALESLAADLIGTPFVHRGRDPAVGLDCYGLVIVLYRLRWSIDLPHYATDGSRRHAAEAARMIAADAAQSWSQVAAGQERAGDVVVIRRLGLPLHLGIVLRPGLMAHADEPAGVTMPRYDGALWCSKVSAFFRHSRLISISA